jgi:hypothetical protein
MGNTRARTLSVVGGVVVGALGLLALLAGGGIVAPVALLALGAALVLVPLAART